MPNTTRKVRRRKIAVRRHGESFRDYFWRRVDRSGGDDSCWRWISAPHKTGYGYVVLDGRQCRAHRVAYELTHGPIPPGAVLMHLCNQKDCCRPDHLEVGTPAENSRMAVKDGLWGQAKLTDADVMAIRRLAAVAASASWIAEVAGVSRSTIYHAVRGDGWMHLPGAIPDFGLHRPYGVLRPASERAA